MAAADRTARKRRGKQARCRSNMHRSTKASTALGRTPSSLSDCCFVRLLFLDNVCMVHARVCVLHGSKTCSLTLRAHALAFWSHAPAMRDRTRAFTRAPLRKCTSVCAAG